MTPCTNVEEKHCDLGLPCEVIKAEMSETLKICIQERLSPKCQTAYQFAFPFLCKRFSFLGS